MGIIRWAKKFPLFLKEVGQELKKVNWSTRQELVAATAVVLAGSAFLTVYIALVDASLSKLMQYFLIQ